MVTAGVTNRSSTPVKALPVKLEVDGRLVDTRTVSVERERRGVGDVPGAHGRERTCARTVRAGTDALPADNDFNFVLSPSRPVSVLIVQAEGAASSFYLDDRARHRDVAAVQDRRAVAVARDAGQLREALGRRPERHDAALRRRPTRPLNRFVDAGRRTVRRPRAITRPWNGASPLLPGKLGATVERLSGGGGTLGFLDSQPSDLRAVQGSARTATSPTSRFFKYRTLDAARRPTRSWPGSTTAPRRWWNGAWAAAASSRSRRRWTRPGMISRRTYMFLPLVHETVQLPGAVPGAGGLVHRGPDARHLRARRGDRPRGRRRATPGRPRGEPTRRRHGAVRRAGHDRRGRRAVGGTGGAGVLFGAPAGARRSPAVRGRGQSGSRRVGSVGAAGRRVRGDRDGPRGGDLHRAVARASGADAARIIEKKQSVWWYLLRGRRGRCCWSRRSWPIACRNAFGFGLS